MTRYIPCMEAWVCCNGILGVWGEVEEQGHVWVFLGCLQMLSHTGPAVFWQLAVLSPKWPGEERRTGFCLKALCAARRKWLCLFKLSCPLWACLAMWDKWAKSVPQFQHPPPPHPIPCVFLWLNSSHPIRLGAGGALNVGLGIRFDRSKVLTHSAFQDHKMSIQMWTKVATSALKCKLVWKIVWGHLWFMSCYLENT